MGNTCCGSDQFRDIDNPKTTFVEPEPEVGGDGDVDKIKFVLLGAGDSGKSTLYKQMKINYSKDFSNESLLEQKDQIIKSIYMSFGDFLKSVKKVDPDLGGNVELLAHSNSVFPNTAPVFPKTISEQTKSLMQSVWTSESGQEIWSTHEKYPITDTLNYFMENLDRFCDKGYVPSEEDLLKARIQTTGVLEQTFQYKGVTMTVVDVGGQRAERKKWFQAIDGCTAVLFVTSLSAFNQALYEDTNTMRLPEALGLFKKTFNFLPFRLSETPFVLFMNKEDLFLEKLEKMEQQGTNLDEFFPELGLGTKYDNAAIKIKEHIRDQFLGMCTDQQRGRVIPHYITATDKGIFLKIFQAAAQVVLRRAIAMHFNPEEN